MSWTPSHSTPFKPSQQLSLPFPGSTFQPPPRSDLITARSDLQCPGRRCGKGCDAEHGTSHLGELPANLWDEVSTCLPGKLATGCCVKHVCPRSPLQPPAGPGGELPSHAPRLISERFPGRPQPDFPEVAQSALNGSGFNVGGRWAPHKGPSPLQAGLSTCLIKS